MPNNLHKPNPEVIRSMFSKVAANYDKANSVLSMGVHHLWRKKLVKLSEVDIGDHVLDCATGTGDLALEFKNAVGPTGTVIGTDFCVEMLESAPAKALKKNLEVKFEQADVTHLPYENESFDVASISFGIRNVSDPVLGLKEMARVVKAGGTVMVLEFGQVYIPGFVQAYNFYSEKVLPMIGGMVTGQKEAYQYLQKSSANFPCREGFLNLMRETDSFAHVECHALTGGIAYIYKGIKK